MAVLNETKIDAVYSTAFKRTKNTAAPIAEVKALSVLTYEAFKESVIDSMLVKHRGETVVLVGHSNSIPWTANYLLGEKRFSDFVDSDYNNLLLISVLEKGTASVIWLNFGSPK
ncbi:MAG: histidine phosphatase family protein [Flammeovirgaceae bacterium]|nr:histidine phosphatase family protein [Flammeovirgaceae bacterium]